MLANADDQYITSILYVQYFLFIGQAIYTYAWQFYITNLTVDTSLIWTLKARIALTISQYLLYLVVPSCLL